VTFRTAAYGIALQRVADAERLRGNWSAVWRSRNNSGGRAVKKQRRRSKTKGGGRGGQEANAAVNSGTGIRPKWACSRSNAA